MRYGAILLCSANLSLIGELLATTAAFREIIPTGLRIKIERVIAEGDSVAVEFEGNSVLANGTPYGNQYVFLFTFENGKIKRINEYFCTVLADTAILPLLAEKSAAMAHGVEH